MNGYETEVSAAIALVEGNYAGYADKRARFGAATIDGAAASALSRAASAGSDAECDRILYDYTRVFDDGHLSAILLGEDGEKRSLRRVFDPTYGAPRPESWTGEPSARALSKDTFLVTIPDFDLERKEALDALVAAHDSEIKSRANLIVDVRGNGGGSDATYDVLRPLIYSRPITHVGVDVLATKANADAWREVLSRYFVTDAELMACFHAMMERMVAVPEGTFIPWSEDSTDTFPEVFALPATVAILIDRGCASTTEQFLLEVRQSDKVTLYGETTAGVLDYSNVRPFHLPSGKRLLGIATTRSRRLPDHPVDNIGITPDVAIPDLTRPRTPGDSAVEFVLAALEGPRPPRA